MVSGVVHVMHNGRWFVGRVVTEVLGHDGLFEVSFVNPDPADGRCLGAIFRPDEIKEGPVVVSELAEALLSLSGEPALQACEWGKHSIHWCEPVSGEYVELMMQSIKRDYLPVEAGILIGILRKHARAAGVDVSVAAA